MNKLVDIGDKTAICLSLLCVLHCIALPLLLILLPAASSIAFLDDEKFHLWLVFAVAPISIFAVAMAYKHHRQVKIMMINIIGIFFLIGALTFGHDLFAGKGEVVLTLIGSVMIVYSHLINFRERRRQACQTPIDQAI